MEMNKIYSMLSLAKKAGALKFGEDGCEKSIQNGDAKLVFIAVDASDNTKKKFMNKCKFYGVDAYIVLTKAEIEARTGMANRAVVSVMDDSFARNIRNILNDNEVC